MRSRFTLLFLALTPLAAAAQTPTGLVRQASDAAVLDEMRLRNIGPAVMSGRISDIAVQAPTRPGERWGRVVYVTSAGGGAWKTTNAGKTWQPLTDDLPVASMGAIAVAPSDSNVVYLGSGESNNLRSSSWGNGVYKSTDGGATWTHVGLERSQHIARIVVHPRDANTAYVAAMGPLWGPGGERGLYKTTDGGRTWRAVKTINETTGFTDVVLDPTNPELVYAAAYQRERRPWSFVAGGEHTGIWRSADGGATWTEINQGLPAGAKGRIGIDAARSQPRTLYATIHHADSSGVYRTDDGGANWRRVSNVTSIPWFFGQIRVDPKDAERVYFLGVQLQVSADGGRTWQNTGQNTHADNHAMWIDPEDPTHLIIGNDGGLFFSHDRGRSWDFALNLPVSTFYAIGYDMSEPFYRVYGGLQDNGTWGAPIATRDRSGILNTDWQRVGGGDGFYAQIDPNDPSIVFVESQNGNIRRVDARTGESKDIRPRAPDGMTLRYNWSAPILISPHDARTVYFGSSVVFKSTDRGDTWTAISGDLTRRLDRDTLPIMGMKGPGGLGRHDGTAPFGNIATLDESKRVRGLVWAGTDDGLVHVSRDDGRNWTRVDSFPGAPRLTYVSRVIASHHADGTAYVTLDGHRNNDFKPYVYRTTDFGRTWTSITSNLPQHGSLQVIREHHRNPDLLFVGSEFGVFVSINGGRSWSELSKLPTAAVHDLLIHPRENDLILGTHGRGIWVLDDITPLEKLAEAAAQRAYVFAPRAATIFNPAGGPTTGPGHRRYSGDNLSDGAMLSYWIGTPGGVSLAIVSATGETVRTLNADSTVGVHRLFWDLRRDPVVAGRERTQGGDEDEEGPPFARQAGIPGPYVTPGTYRVQLQSGGQVLHEATLDVRRDPLVSLTDAQLATLYEARQRAYTLQRDARTLAQRLEDARTRLAAARGSADTMSGPGAAARALERELEAVLAGVCGPVRRGPGGGPPATAFAQCGPAAGGGFGGGFGGGGGGGAQGAFQRATRVASDIGSSHFLPTPEHRADHEPAATTLNETRTPAEALLGRVDAAARALGGR